MDDATTVLDARLGEMSQRLAELRTRVRYLEKTRALQATYNAVLWRFALLLAAEARGLASDTPDECLDRALERAVRTAEELARDRAFSEEEWSSLRATIWCLSELSRFPYASPPAVLERRRETAARFLEVLERFSRTSDDSDAGEARHG